MKHRSMVICALVLWICGALAGCRDGQDEVEECTDEDENGILDCLEDIDCFDEDGDGYGVGRDCAGPDCDDRDEEHAVECPHDVAYPCMDGDGDGYGEGRGCDGPDCDDTNPHCNEYCDASCLNRTGNLCDDARDLDDCDVGYSGDTTEMSDTYNLHPSLSFTGPDQVWDINCVYDTYANIDVTPESGFDIALCYSTRGCSMEDFHCVNSTGSGSQETIRVRNTTNALKVIVDGVNEDAGAYTISVHNEWY